MLPQVNAHMGVKIYIIYIAAVAIDLEDVYNCIHYEVLEYLYQEYNV